MYESPKFTRFKKSGSKNTMVTFRFFTGSGNRAISRMRNEKYAIAFIYSRIAKIIASQRKLGSRNTMVTSDFRPEVEIRPFRARAMHPAIIIGTVRSLWTWLWGRYHVPQNSFLVIISFFISKISSHFNVTM